MKRTSENQNLTENAVTFPCYIDVKAVWYGRKAQREKTVSEDLAEKVLSKNSVGNKNSRNYFCGK